MGIGKPTSARLWMEGSVTALFMLFCLSLFPFTLTCYRSSVQNAVEAGKLGQDLPHAPSSSESLAEEASINAFNGSTWSVRSGFSTIVALCFGYYAQPRGSMHFPNSCRTWRLSQLFAILDTVAVIGRVGWIRLETINDGKAIPSISCLAVSIQEIRTAADDAGLKLKAKMKAKRETISQKLWEMKVGRTH